MDGMTIHPDEQTLIALLRMAWGGAEQPLPGGEVDWQSVYELSLRQGVTAVACEGLLRLPSVDEGVRYNWMAQTLLCEMDCERKIQATRKLSQMWAEQGIHGVVLKGLAFAQHYANPTHRPFGDLDVFLFDGWEAGNRVAEDAGVTVRRGYYKHSTLSFQGLTVENHRFCTPIRGGRRRKQYERYLQQLLRQEPLTPVEGVPLLSPPPLFNLIFFLSHARNHFLNEGGVTLRFVCDWAALLQAYGPDGDCRQPQELWHELLRRCRDYDLSSFAMSMSRLAQQVCGVAAPFGCGADDAADRLLLADMLASNVAPVEFSQGWRTRWQLIRSVLGSRRKFHYFSRRSMPVSLLESAWAYCTDRHPSL